jgi:ParB-like chromosome segregation protein Spo0J
VKVQIEDIRIEDFDLSLMELRLINETRTLQVERSMKVHGQLQPVVARVHEGGIQLIDGYKRLAAAEVLVMDTLECRLLEVDES